LLEHHYLPSCAAATCIGRFWVLRRLSVSNLWPLACYVRGAPDRSQTSSPSETA
jgi:hypothetical protein